MAGPGDQTAAAGAAGRGRLRVSHADREQVIEALKVAFVQDRLTKDEFDARVGQAFASRTRAELAALIADLPAGLMAVLPPRQPAPAPEKRTTVPMNTAITGCAFLLIAANAAMLGAFLTGNAAVVLLVGVVTLIGAVVAIGAVILAR
jgi:hypothetical protein